MANGRNPRAARGRSRQAQSHPKALVTMSYEGNLSDRIKELERRILSKVLRPAAYAGARVIYVDMLMRVPIDSGQLVDSIYHWFDRKRSTASKKTYWIGPNKVKAPHWYNVEYGHWRYNRVANGIYLKSKSNRNARVSAPGVMDRSVHNLGGALDVPVWVPASPYIRPAWDAQKTNALSAVKKRAGEKLREVIGEVART